MTKKIVQSGIVMKMPRRLQQAPKLLPQAPKLPRRLQQAPKLPRRLQQVRHQIQPRRCGSPRSRHLQAR